MDTCDKESAQLLRAPLARRSLLKALAGSTLAGLKGFAVQGEKAPAFKVRATQDCGWNTFRRKGWSTAPQDISVNYNFLDHLREAGLNWVFVFWTHTPAFDDAWAKASQYAHSHGLRVARAIYVFAGGETAEEYQRANGVMGEANVPADLLRMSARGTKTALCPHDPETREWVAKWLEKRVQPSIDGILFEPPADLSEQCVCEQCQALGRLQLNVFMANFVTEHLKKVKPDLEVMLNVNATTGLRRGWTARASRKEMAAAYRDLNSSIHYIFGWLTDMTATETDNEASFIDWLDADPRFDAYTRLSRVILFPDGKVPTQSVEERTATAFRWARLAADRGKKAYSYDWRLFGGYEWKGHEKMTPATRLSKKLPASLALMGATLKEPYLDEKGQRELLKKLRATAEWDLDDPAAFYPGA
jgi:hypothetical protein